MSLCAEAKIIIKNIVSESEELSVYKSLAIFNMYVNIFERAQNRYRFLFNEKKDEIFTNDTLNEINTSLCKLALKIESEIDKIETWYDNVLLTEQQMFSSGEYNERLGFVDILVDWVGEYNNGISELKERLCRDDK